MTKILKNSSGSDIALDVLGLPSIPDAGQVTIQEFDYILLASEDSVNYLSPLITSGDIVVNDGVNDLSPTQGNYYIKYPNTAYSVRFLSDPDRLNGFISKNTQEAIEEARDVALNVRGKLVDFEYSTTGNTQNRWAAVGHPSQPSNDLPFVANWDGVAVGLSFSNNNDSVDCDIEFYINGTLEYTWEIRNKRTAWEAKVDEEEPLFEVSQGDRISIFIKKVTGGTGFNPASVNGSIEVMITAMGDGNGGTASGV